MEYKEPKTLKQAIALLHYQESRGCSQATLEGTLAEVTNFIKYKEKKRLKRGKAPEADEVLRKISTSSQGLRVKVTGLSEAISLGAKLDKSAFMGYSSTLASFCELVYLRDRINELFELGGIDAEGQVKLRSTNALNRDCDSTPAKDMPARREASRDRHNRVREEFLNSKKAL